ncbi:ABC transporter substrate-binding protein [Virgibacillus pantothenticus]|uniref:ABC transporter substrate-binding protein n=1 Tax=Virgibacillus pantothenticus TaxID=1473 RepID=A0A0L0QMI6_VIRPA|nr:MULTISPECIES: ABC transporter substrate-binding protein [Virgibacillus]API93524.1 ABC transporter substrate-binding protein [Virgibacillus sp. 6R]KNE19817.1 ABC transporter substrate-binding protein [Virgibacillus pantothenticus]MBS7430092.1 ABC transporter substrate-binding protein [Virgibacillus sp. 19R1-5]MBU8566330.1 ABC transporter substrate-binding protein [Virgibacillus pantothenticus]MBU8600753.1 ABC transporter substrate-binding protein [Virgibacillus pantothenticus]
MRKFIMLSLFIILLAACSTNGDESGKKEKAADKNLKEVSIVLDWTPNTNHTGLYVAKEKGYFKEQGLNVDIKMPGEAGADQLVASGKADFGIGAQEGITEARVQDIPIVSIAAIIQHNTSGFASPKEKDITEPKDFEGKTYGGWGAPVEKAVINSLMKQDGADVEKVDIVNMGETDFFTAVERDIDFAWIYYGWTGVEAELRNEEVNMVYLTDYSEKLDYYTPVLTTNETMIEEEPETIKKFLAAVSKGYELAIDNPEEAADILIKAVPDLDEDLVKASQKWLADKYQDDADRWGEQKQEVWENYSTWMFDNELLDKPLDSEKAFTNEFLPEK